MKVAAGNNGSTENPFELRIGYFGKRKLSAKSKTKQIGRIINRPLGICVGNSTKALSCAHTLSSTPDDVITRLKIKPDDETNNLVQIGLILQSKITIWLIAFAGIFYLGGVICVTAFKASLKRQSRSRRTEAMLKKAAVIILWVSVALCLTATAGVTQTVNGMQFILSREPGQVLIKNGPTIEALQWILVALSALFAIGVNLMVNSGGGNSSGGWETDVFEK